jgi:hypothetical protein
MSRRRRDPEAESLAMCSRGLIIVNAKKEYERAEIVNSEGPRK